MKKLTIRNFGPITSIEDLEVKDFMVFIGPQASGKSTVAKLLYFLKNVREYTFEYLFEILESGKSTKSLEAFVSIKFLNFWHSGGVFSENAFIQYSFSADNSITLDRPDEHGIATVTFEPFLKAKLDNLIQRCESYNSANNNLVNEKFTSAYRMIQESELVKFKQEIAERINRIFNEEEPLFIPASRAAITTFSDFLDLERALDRPTHDFIREVRTAKRYFDKTSGSLLFEDSDPKAGGSITPHERNRVLSEVNSILKGEYRLEGNREYLYLNHENKIDLQLASSGQQEALWILGLIVVKILYKVKTSIIIEEPEAHLFPDAQKGMVELIAHLFNSSQTNQALITTHSPYILTALNNLLFAFEAGQSQNTKVSQIIPRRFWLDQNRFAAYMICDGSVEPIMKDGLIQAEKIDEISSQIFSQFDQIFDVINEKNAPTTNP